VLKVGLTGNIASGKSAVARVWRGLGARIVEADELARRAVEPGTPALARIVEEWGEGVLSADGRLDRATLREIVFRDAAARRRLEAIVHPAVRALRDEEYRAAEASGEEIVVADIPLLFEVGMEEEFDLVVLVDAPADARRERIVRDRGLRDDEARRMIEAQTPAAEKRGRADLVIENDGTLADLEAEARRAWERIRERAGAAGRRGGADG
jgi:dephospho-CoA kinase